MKSFTFQLWRHWLVLLLLAVGTAHAGETVTYYSLDAEGSPVVATDASGHVIWTRQYQPYGVQSPAPAQGTMAPSYTGKLNEADTGLLYYGARWYDPALGRFVSMDPAGFRQSDPQSFNPYEYAADNPYRYIDPSGKEELEPGSVFAGPGWLEMGGEDAAGGGSGTTGCGCAADSAPDTTSAARGPSEEVTKKEVTWPTARKRYWRARANAAEDGEFSPENLERMKKGNAPRHDELGVSKELHHKVPQRDGGSHDSSNLQEVWPWEHDGIDPFRHYKGPRPGGE